MMDFVKTLFNLSIKAQTIEHVENTLRFFFDIQFHKEPLTSTEPFSCTKGFIW